MRRGRRPGACRPGRGYVAALAWPFALPCQAGPRRGGNCDGRARTGCVHREKLTGQGGWQGSQVLPAPTGGGKRTGAGDGTAASRTPPTAPDDPCPRAKVTRQTAPAPGPGFTRLLRVRGLPDRRFGPGSASRGRRLRRRQLAVNPLTRPSRQTSPPAGSTFAKPAPGSGRPHWRRWWPPGAHFRNSPWPGGAVIATRSCPRDRVRSHRRVLRHRRQPGRSGPREDSIVLHMRQTSPVSRSGSAFAMPRCGRCDAVSAPCLCPVRLMAICTPPRPPVTGCFLLMGCRGPRARCPVACGFPNKKTVSTFRGPSAFWFAPRP